MRIIFKFMENEEQNNLEQTTEPPDFKESEIFTAQDEPVKEQPHSDANGKLTENNPPVGGEKEAKAQKKSKQKKPKSKKKHSKAWLTWGISVFFLSFVLTVVFSFLTEISVKDSASYVCVIVLIVLLVLNISCDVLANAIMSISPEAFHAMASNKIKGAKRSVSFCRNATKLSSIFADVIGDIVSGAAGTALVAHVATVGTTGELIASIGISAAIGALTVGGKAIFKHFAVKFNKQIVFGFAKFTTVFKRER